MLNIPQTVQQIFMPIICNIKKYVMGQVQIKMAACINLHLATNRIFTPVAIDEAKQRNCVKRGYTIVGKTFPLVIFII